MSPKAVIIHLRYLMLGSDWPGGLKLKNLIRLILSQGRLCRTLFFHTHTLGVAQTHPDQSKLCVFVLLSDIVGFCCLATRPQVLCLAFTPLGVVRNKYVSNTHMHRISLGDQRCWILIRGCACVGFLFLFFLPNSPTMTHFSNNLI